MPWTTPIAPVSGTTITVSWAVANVVNLMNWLRGLTGNADPPAGGYVIASTSTSLTTWSKVGAGLMSGDGSTSCVMGTDPSGNPFWQKIIAAMIGTNQIFHTHMNGEGSASRVMATDPSGNPNWQQIIGAMIGTNQVTGGNTGHLSLAPGQRVVGNNVEDNTIPYGKLSYANSPTANDHLIFNGSALAWQTPAAGVSGVPTGMIAAFATGSMPTGWTRYTPLNGRLPVGDGSTAGQTFIVGNNYGSGWSHQHDLQNHTHAGPNHQHTHDHNHGSAGLTFSGSSVNTGDGSNNQNQVNVSTPGTNVSLAPHTHAVTAAGSIGGSTAALGAGPLTGAAGNGATAGPSPTTTSNDVIAPLMFCVVWGQKT